MNQDNKMQDLQEIKKNMKKKFATSKKISTLDCLPLSTESDELGNCEVEIKPKRKTMRKLLTLPLTHVLVHKDETYDISKEFKFLNVLGLGTYAQVQLAEDLKTDELVAVKVSRGDTSIEMLKREKEILDKISSEYFPKVIDFKVDKIWKKGYLVLEYIRGVTLEEYLKNGDSIDEEIICSFISQLC